MSVRGKAENRSIEQERSKRYGKSAATAIAAEAPKSPR
jgi:hypothetical protein